MLVAPASRNVSSVEGTGYHVATSTDNAVGEVIKHLDILRPTYTLIYFVAGWNPACSLIERDYVNLTRDYPDFHHIRVDCDEHPKLARYFDVRLQPSFLALVKGGEIARINHYNFEKIGIQLESISSLHQDQSIYYGTTGSAWERFYDEFDKWQLHGEQDRDATIMKHETQSDRHRGPGTGNA